MKMLAQFLALNTCSVNLGGREKRRKEGREERKEGEKVSPKLLRFGGQNVVAY